MILQILSKSITKKRTSNKMFVAAYAVAFASVTLTTLVPCDKHSAGKGKGIINETIKEQEDMIKK